MSVDNVVADIQVKEPKSSKGLFDLPCGYIDESGTLHTEVALREITGVEEDMLAAPKIPPYKKMNDLLTNCVTRIGSIVDRGKLAEVVKDLTVGDRTFLMFAIRRVTLGDEYPFKFKCPECEQESTMIQNLEELEIRAMKDPMRRVYEGKSASGAVVKFHVLTGREEEKLQKAVKSEGLSMAIYLRVEAYNGKKPDIDTVKSWSMKERNSIRDLFDGVEGGVDTTLEIACPSCGEEVEQDLDISQGFFFPSQVQKRSKKRSSS